MSIIQFLSWARDYDDFDVEYKPTPDHFIGKIYGVNLHFSGEGGGSERNLIDFRNKVVWAVEAALKKKRGVK